MRTDAKLMRGLGVGIVTTAARAAAMMTTAARAAATDATSSYGR